MSVTAEQFKAFIAGYSVGDKPGTITPDETARMTAEAKRAAGWIEIAPNHWRLPDAFPPPLAQDTKPVRVNQWTDRAIAQRIAPRYRAPEAMITSRPFGVLVTTTAADAGTDDPMAIAQFHRSIVRRLT